MPLHGCLVAQRAFDARVTCGFCLRLLVLWAALARSLHAQLPPAWEWQRDAALHDVVLVDAENGWAVGDRGVIWHTHDGGQSWQPQQSNVGCTLWSVSFHDATTGWAVGAEPSAWGAPAHSMILRTFDGGAHWDVDRSLPLAGLRGVRLFSPQDACVWGDCCGATPGGVLWTSDGGRSWQALSGDSPHCDWLLGDFANPAAGLLISDQKRLYRVQAGQATAVAQTALRQVRAVRLAPAGDVAWAVGDGSLALCTHDAGRTWSPPAAELPAGLNFDARAVAARSAQCWVAGDPGALVWHSSDAGRTWSSFRTGVTTPLEALAFRDERHGVAVGALGCILATHDGGATWNLVQHGGRRAALLAVYARSDDLPWEVLAQLCASEGYLAYVHVVGREAGAAGADRSLWAAREAALACGATGLGQSWKFPLPSREVQLSPATLWAQWDALHEGRARVTLDTELARCLRVWRPDVVLTHAIDLAGDDGAATVVREAVLRALELAAAESAPGEAGATAELPAIGACSVYGCGPADDVSSQSLAVSQIATNLGSSLVAYTATPRAWLQDSALPPAAWVFPQYAEATDDGERPFLQAFKLPSGGDGRRVFRLPDDAQQQAQLREARAWQAAAAALAHDPAAEVQPVAHLAQLGDALSPLSPAGAATLLQQLAAQARRDGQWALETELLRELCGRYPEQSAGAARRLLAVQVSAELALVRGRASDQEAAPSGAADVSAAPTPLQRPIEFAFEPADDRWQVAGLAAEQLRTVHPLWWGEPDVQLALALLARATEQPQRAEQIWEQLVQRRSDGFARCAATERWLTVRAGRCPVPCATAAPAARPPRLDGALDEPFWTDAVPVALQSLAPAAVPATSLQFAWDERFFYLAAQCDRAAAAPADAAPEGPRPRDAPLEAHDRLELWLDVDRDRSTAFCLSIDARGWTHDACDGHSGWNPAWFVAQSQTPEGWTIEAAVPLEELSYGPVQDGAWAVALTRIVPQAGLATWPRGTARPPLGAEFGLLRFGAAEAP